MKKSILVICQLYWPDGANLAAHLTDVTQYMSKKGHDITVFSSNHAYENTKDKYPKRERFGNIKVERISDFGFGKKNKIGRILDIISFNVNLLFKLLFIKRKNFDLILGLTNPPLISFFGVFVAKLKKIDFHYWAMDLQPQLAFRSGYLNPKSVPSRIFNWMSVYIMKQSHHIIALDKYMKSFISEESGNNNISIVPVWPTAPEKKVPLKVDNEFRIMHNLEDKVVVMYSGNHCATHPLDTLLEAALLLKSHSIFKFVFIGAGIRKQDVIDFKEKNGLDSILILPYQPRNYLHISLSAADLQVVVMGDNLTGLTHPSKIYSNMQLGCPSLYIGPVPSHASDLLDESKGNLYFPHGAQKELSEALIKFASISEKELSTIKDSNRSLIKDKYHPTLMMEKIEKAITAVY